MRVSCPSCQTNYNIDDKRVPPGGAKLKCSKCQTLFPIKAAAPGDQSGAIPLPGAGGAPATGGAIPLPGSAAPPASSGAIPLPGSAAPPSSGGAIPLPGSAGPSPSASGAIPLPGITAAAPAAIPLPGITAPRPASAHVGGTGDPFGDPGDGFGAGERWDEESTRVASLPLPTEAYREPPIPGPEPVTGAYPKANVPAELFAQAAAAPMDFSFDGGGGDAVPLPGSAAPAPEAPSGFDFDFGAPPTEDAGAVPLPGSYDAGAVPLPGSYDAGAVPLPGSGGAIAPPPPDDFAMDFGAPQDSGAVPLPGSSGAIAPPPPSDFAWDPPQQAEQDASAVPLPEPDHSQDFAVDFSDSPPPAAPAPVESFDFSDLPSPAGAPPPAHAESLDFDDLPSPAGAPPPQPSSDFGIDFADLPAPASPAIAPPPPAMDFSDLPSPTGSAPPPAQDYSIDFSDLPAPASAAPAPPADDFSLDFADLPAPAASRPAPVVPPAPAGFDDLPAPGDPYANVPAQPAAPVDVSASFGEVDFGDPSPAPAAAPAPRANFGDDLEFDPMSAPKAQDEFEADLSSPLPPPKPAQAADGLEMLSFIDDQAKDAGASKSVKKRFHVRRRSGKVFGPFEEGVIVKMLEDGQLLGNEDVSPDGESWSAIGTVPAFSGALQKLMEAPAAALTSAPEQKQQPQDSAEAMERLKNLYEGRMAAVTVVDKRAETEQFRRRLPLFIAAGVLAVIVAIGAGLGATRYGFFALKLLVPAKVSPGTPQFTELEKAKAALLADTFKGYSEARDLSQKILAVKEFPEVRAVWSQAIFYLQRRYAAAKPMELQLARSELINIQLIGDKHPEVVKALAGEALTANRADEARLLLEDAVIRIPNDPELKLLLAEAYVARNQADRAIQTLEKVLAQKADSAKAMHALGLLHQKNAERLRNSGKREESAKEAERAEELFANALKADPQHVISAVELAAIELLVHKNLDDASAALDKALAEESRKLMGPAELSRARALNATAMAERFQVKEAVAEFEEALKLDKDSVFVKAQLGRIYMAQREFAKAVPLFREASQKEPTNLDYVDGYLSVLIGSGKMQDALTALGSANNQFPDTPRIAYLDARVNDALDNSKKAEDNYLRAIKSDPALVEANLHLARMYLRMRRLEDARVQLEEAIKKAPDNALVNAGMGELLFEEGQYSEARLSFERSAQTDPNLADAQLGLSRVALIDNRVEDAARYVSRALELDPTIKGGYLQQGLVFWSEGKLDEAITALDEAKKNEPSNAKILIKLGAVKLDKKDLPGAEAALAGALSVEPRNHEANFYLARVKSRRAEHNQAIESMKAALDAAPKNPHYRYEMGIILREAKKLQEAMEEWKETIALDPNYAEAMEALGQAHLDRGEFEPAIAQFEAALKVDPARARLHGLMGDAHFQAAQWDLAVKRYRTALQAEPTLTYVYYKIGRALSEQGKPQDAIGWYRKATTAEPENAMPWYYLGFLYKERIQRKDAITAFKSYLTRRPDAPDKREIEDEIYDLEQGI